MPSILTIVEPGLELGLGLWLGLGLGLMPKASPCMQRASLCMGSMCCCMTCSVLGGRRDMGHALHCGPSSPPNHGGWL